MITLHATCVDIDGRGVLLRGASGAGKSDLALRLIDAGAKLVSDDYVRLSLEDGGIRARPPKAIAGMIEARGIGVVTVPHLAGTTLALVADLVDSSDIPRLPDALTLELEGLEGIELRHILIAPFEASAPAKIRLALSSEPVRSRD
ncbi:MAG: HPr kinase/phosphorylase [Alphaproteobacteria bacterium]